MTPFWASVKSPFCTRGSSALSSAPLARLISSLPTKSAIGSSTVGSLRVLVPAVAWADAGNDSGLQPGPKPALAAAAGERGLGDGVAGAPEALTWRAEEREDEREEPAHRRERSDAIGVEVRWR